MSDISVIGLGAMGSALARALVKAGHGVTVWNRSRQKMEPLVGLGAVVKPCVRIGCGAVVGAGAVVVDDLPDHVVAAGVPAKVLRRIETHV